MLNADGTSGASSGATGADAVGQSRSAPADRPDTPYPGVVGGCQTQPRGARRHLQYLDLTLPSPAENLACDEALLEAAEAGVCGETLRCWEPREYFVVLGYANRASLEVDLEACRQQRVPVFRRCSGGGAVLQGPGCLNYNLVLEIDEAGPLANVTSTNRFIMQRHATALATLLKEVAIRPSVQVQGHTDLTLGDRKFAGNSQRRRRRYLVFHGCFLLHADLAVMQQFLRFPSKQPCYRKDRSHRDFLTNLPLRAEDVKAALRCSWQADEVLAAAPAGWIDRLVGEKYATEEWNLKYR